MFTTYTDERRFFMLCSGCGVELRIRESGGAVRDGQAYVVQNLYCVNPACARSGPDAPAEQLLHPLAPFSEIEK